jgi:hypothetical protein
MKTNAAVLTLFLAALAGTPALCAAQGTPGQNLLSSSDPMALEADAGASAAPDDNAYADGVRAVNSGRWSDAIAIFARIAAQGSTHADAALYWKAYAEDRQDQGGTAIETCGTLRRDHPGSNWIEECGALEIEIHSKNGKPVQPQAEQSDDLKLLALASLMQHDEKKALKEIDEILNSDSSEKLKKGALFIMGEHHTDTMYPQIARLSFVDGDVRITRGEVDEHHKSATWEEAKSDLPIEAGYSIVTGEGRAEIELENASTLYLAPNSVLTINDLSSTAGIPNTDMALLSGTVTLHVRPYVEGEMFTLRTPTDNVVTKYPQTGYLRISSYTDGMALTPMSGGTLGVRSGLGLGHEDLTPGNTLYFKDNYRIMDAGPIHPPDFSSWDRWVADRTAAREQAMAEALKASGLNAPVPGLADLAGQGKFFPCEPYGTCWTPTPSAASQTQADVPAQRGKAPEQSEVASRAVADTSSAQSSTTRNIRFVGPPAASGPPPQYSDFDAFYPCIPGQMRAMFWGGVVPASAQYQMQPWAWAVCHSGSWIYNNNRYVWVAGRCHHHPPLHWIKYGNTMAVVPTHPRDVKNHLPVNRMAPVLAVNSRNGHSIERLQFGNSRAISLIKDTPKEFRTTTLAMLPHVAEPHMEAHSMKDLAAAKGSPIKPAGTPITFNAKSQSFMMAHDVVRGGHSVAVMTPMGNRGGDLQNHAGAFNGGGNRGGEFSGGYHGGEGGGASHGGGSSGSSGGASHGGGGGSSSSASSGSSSGTSGGGSSGGGSHK